MENSNFATRWNIDEVESNYLKWLKEPQTLDANWRLFFEGFHLGADAQINESISEVSSLEKSSVEVVNRNDAVEKHARLYGAIYSYRDIGHTQGTFDPLKEEIVETQDLVWNASGLILRIWRKSILLVITSGD